MHKQQGSGASNSSEQGERVRVVAIRRACESLDLNLVALVAGRGRYYIREEGDEEAREEFRDSNPVVGQNGTRHALVQKRDQASESCNQDSDGMEAL